MRKIDLTGQRFGNLVAISEMKERSKRGQISYLCKCDCGNEVVVLANNLKRGNSKTCGCSHTRHKYGDISTKHIRLYRTYYSMKQRCYNERSSVYNHYGGRGITICDEWLSSFEAFRDWALKNGYADNLTIERINVNGNYCPENCCWITQAEQLNNTRNSIVITHDGLTMNLMQWSKYLGKSYDALKGRIDRGWSFTDTLTVPVKKYKRRKTKNEQNALEAITAK